jgi:4-hydroxythreonine-4-phosphate dehydrogenase
MHAIALTPGDPSGVGPEILMMFLRDLPPGGPRPVVLGDRRILSRAEDLVGHHPRWREVRWDAPVVAPDEVGFYPVPWEHAALPVLGEVNAEAGAYAYRVLEAVGEPLMAGQVPGVVTGPISKEAIQRRRPDFIGHTEFFAGLAGVTHFGMLLVVEPLRAIHVTTHVPLREVSALLTPVRIRETLDLARLSLEMLGEPEGAIAVCGLNPHAGEAGHFGREELEAIAPAIHAAQRDGMRVLGPLPPDTVFHRALQGEFQVVVCMYHDQGHIPLKMLGFDRGINVTVGLPFVRTSVDHGTAFDLAGTGAANPGSLKAAWSLAVRLHTH